MAVFFLFFITASNQTIEISPAMGNKAKTKELNSKQKHKQPNKVKDRGDNEFN